MRENVRGTKRGERGPAAAQPSISPLSLAKLLSNAIRIDMEGRS